MSYNPDTQSHHLILDLVDNMTSFSDFDRAVSVLIEWGLIEADTGAEAPQIWKESQESQDSPARRGRADSIRSGARVGRKYFPT
jgi:hypothetical protein